MWLKNAWFFCTQRLKRATDLCIVEGDSWRGRRHNLYDLFALVITNLQLIDCWSGVNITHDDVILRSRLEALSSGALDRSLDAGRALVPEFGEHILRNHEAFDLRHRSHSSGPSVCQRQTDNLTKVLSGSQSGLDSRRPRHRVPTTSAASIGTAPRSLVQHFDLAAHDEENLATSAVLLDNICKGWIASGLSIQTKEV